METYADFRKTPGTQRQELTKEPVLHWVCEMDLSLAAPSSHVPLPKGWEKGENVQLPLSHAERDKGFMLHIKNSTSCSPSSSNNFLHTSRASSETLPWDTDKIAVMTANISGGQRAASTVGPRY